MAACARCGKDNPDHFKFCGGCGANLFDQRSPVTTQSPGGPVIMRNPPMPSFASVPPPLAPTPWRATVSTVPGEQALLAPLRAHPSDEGARMVYADWLEQRGEVSRAWFVRHEGDVDSKRAVGDPAWRAITSRGDIARCHQEGDTCPERWDKLDACADDERTRTCTTCQQRVQYCVDSEEALRCGFHDQCPITIDGNGESLASKHAFDLGVDLRRRRR